MNPSPRLLAVVSAMPEELSVLLPLLDGATMTHHGGRAFHCGRLDGHDLVLVLCRIGKVAAATTATLLIERFNVDRILFTGVAGALGAGVNVGDVVVARDLLQHDMDASPLFPRYEVPLTGRSRFATDLDMTDRLLAVVTKSLGAFTAWLGDSDTLRDLRISAPRVHQGLVLSGDRFVSSSAEQLALRVNVPEALAVEMEGAAVAQVCHDLDVPFAIVRTISDRADDGAHMDYSRFLQEVAARYTATIVRAWLREF